MSNKIPLIIFIRCFWPADNFIPFSPTRVSNPFSKSLIHSSNPASFKYSFKVSLEIFLPKHKFSLIVKSNKSDSWEIYATSGVLDVGVLSVK